MLEERPSPLQRIGRMNWSLPVLVVLLALVGFVMLRSVSAGQGAGLANSHAIKFALGLVIFFAVACLDIERWLVLALPIYLACIVFLVATTLLSSPDDDAARWILIGGFRFQPSEITKVGVVLAIAALHAFTMRQNLPKAVAYLCSVPIILIPALLVYQQPDLGTALLIVIGGLVVVFLAGVPIVLVLLVIAVGVGGISAVWQSRDTDWQILRDYQYERVDVFLNPDLDPLGAGYNKLQSEIAFGSGGMWGRGYMRGTQTNLDFLPEKHTDFIFAALAEQFGFAGAMAVVGLHVLILIVLIYMLARVREPFARLTIGGVIALFFLYFAVNMWMVVGLFPVVGVPLPLISHGGSAMLTVLVALGLAESAYASRKLRTG